MNVVQFAEKFSLLSLDNKLKSAKLIGESVRTGLTPTGEKNDNRTGNAN